MGSLTGFWGPPGLEELGLDGGSPGRGPGGDSSSVSSLGRDGSAPGSTKVGVASEKGVWSQGKEVEPENGRGLCGWSPVGVALWARLKGLGLMG